jgi:PAS domain S-box-containing protein
VTIESDHAKLHELLIQELQDFAVFLVSPEGRIISWNPGVLRFFGYTQDEFIGKEFADIFTPEDRAARAPHAEMETARRDGRSSDVRWHLCQDQSRVFVEGALHGIRNEAGTLAGFAKIARAVRPVHAAGSMIGTLVEGTDDPIYAVDREGRFVFANAQTARLLGRPIEDLLGHTREEVLPPETAADHRGTDASVMQSRHSRLIEEHFPSKDRGERVILTTKAPWLDSSERVIGLVAIGKDVTSRTAYQAERERLLRELRRTNEELSAFSHVVAHDLSAPLRAVKIYAELLTRHLEGRIDETARQFLSFVTDGASNMENLIESLLRYAESGEELAIRPVNVNAIIDGILHRLEPLMRETNATVTRKVLPEVQADPVRLLQVFQNLIVNAINYSGDAPPRIEISAESSDSEYRFAVSDNGIGIAREHFERIFSPLKRLHGKDVPGSGIGLALCRKIVEGHGGHIWVESRVGMGSTFFFTLPVRPSQRPA